MLYQNWLDKCFNIYVSVIVITNVHSFKSSHTDGIKVYYNKINIIQVQIFIFVGDTMYSFPTIILILFIFV